jgi:hypothetical protein
MLKRLLILLLLLTALQADYSAGESGFAMGNLSSPQAGPSYASIPDVYFVFEPEIIATGPIIVLATPLVTGNLISWTNQPVEIKMVDNNPATWNASLQYRLNNTMPWINYTAPFVVTGNTVLYARAVNATLNIYSELEVTINNIDNDLPQVVATVNPVDYTKTKYKISLTTLDNSSGIKEIINPAGASVHASQLDYIVTESGQYSFKVSDLAGNQVLYAVVVTINQLTQPSAGSSTITKLARPLAYPSIFDPDRENTKLYFELQNAGSVVVRVYDMGGNLVESMSMDAVAGINYVEWDGYSRLEHNKLDSGVYLFYIVGRTGHVYGRGKVILMRDSR